MPTIITFPPELPVSQLRHEIARTIAAHQVVIVAGETGSGKTTQLPKICLELGRERIAHTQPRRIAARTIAERIAEELGSDLGGLVGYQVRFTDKVGADTKIRLMTDGILLNAIHRDRDLRAYDTIIIDEAHERSLNIDFLLGYLKTLLPRRPDLKVIITSATIDPESFAKHFADATGEPAPIIEVSGRTYPVELRYRPLVEEQISEDPKTGHLTTRKRERDLFEAIGAAVDELAREAAGDVLVFLSGEAEIRDATDMLKGRNRGRSSHARAFEVLPLYGRLSAAEQHRVFEQNRSGALRIVLATNVAETSLTVPGIRSVIDAGTARISRYSSRSKVQRLPIEAISQASANQRSGRSGRTSPGIAIRLYSEEDFQSRPEFTEPEILRTGLASVILQMLALGLGEISEFPFLTPPVARDIRDGLALLEELGAVTHARRAGPPRITKIGRELSRLPIEPRFARMVVEARRHGVTDQVVALVAGLTVQDVRERPAEQRGKADELHARFNDPLGDLMTLLNLWNYLREQQQALSSSAFRRLCKAEFLNYLRVREWMDLNRQISRIAVSRRSGSGEVSPEQTAPSDAIHQSVLAGLLSHLGVRDDLQDRRVSGASRNGTPAGRRKPAQEYVGARGTRFVLHPGSTLVKQPPETVMSVELVETSRLFARGNAAIDPAWAEQLAGPLAKRQVSEPRWEKRQGAAVAYERVTLYGVPIVGQRRVLLSRFDLPLARELFIRHALVDGEWDSPHAFDRANRQLRRELQQLEERTRQRGLVGDDDVVFDFYDARIPASVASTRDFEGWWKREQRTSPKLLNMSRDDLLEDDEQTVDETEFPREWRHGDQKLKLRYRFEPGAIDDGVTVTVPLPLLPRVEADQFDKLVPGLREELVTALIRALPKAIRKHVVPAADWGRTLLAAISSQLDGTHDAAVPQLTELLAQEIRRRTSVQVAANDFDLTKLPPHLTPTYRVIDARGRAVGTGKNLAELQHTHKDSAVKGVARVAQAALPQHNLERKGLTSWSFGDLPKHVDSSYAGGRGGAGTVRAYPALVDRRTSVDLVLVADAGEQTRLTRRGIRRLLTLSSPSPASYVRDHLSNDEKLLLGAGPYRTLDDAIADVSLAVADRAIRRVAPDGLIWRADTFEAVADAYATALIEDIYAGIALTARVLGAAREARKAVDAAKSLHVLSQVADAQQQINGLVWAAGSGEGFVSHTGLERLERVVVYLQAVTQRMRALTEHPGRDRARQNDVDRATTLFNDAGGTIPLTPDAADSLRHARWLLEELRVSLFAQQLRTAEPVSLQRIQKVLAAH
ncbi:MAG: ATP-dependent RNA helicase HrpA [Leucobacter sp.]|nr:ATP-dependent RNA helicase HrpA [Leucobacter sp.]